MKEGRMMKGNPIKFILVVMVFMVLFSTDVQAAKLNKTSLTLQKGKTYTLKLQGSKKKATWKTKNKKIASLSNKKKTSVKIKAVKAGKTTITAKVGKKTYKCKVTVVNPTAKKNDKDAPGTEENKKDEQTTNTTTEEKTEQTPAKIKVWVCTKKGVYKVERKVVDKYGVYKCWCGVEFATKDYRNSEVMDENGVRTSEDGYTKACDSHYWEHAKKGECTDHGLFTRYDYENNEYIEQEEGYWTEITLAEYYELCKKGLVYRAYMENHAYTYKDIKTGEEFSKLSDDYLWIDKSSGK